MYYVLRTDKNLINHLRENGLSDKQCSYIRRVWSKTPHEEMRILKSVLGFMLLATILTACMFQALEWPIEFARRLFWVYLLIDVVTTTRDTLGIHKMYTTPHVQIQNQLLSRVNIERYVLSSQRTLWTLILLWVSMTLLLGFASLKVEMIVACLGLVGAWVQFTISRTYIQKRIDEI